jgi:LPXTG-motif cell wall-anchored protein
VLGVALPIAILIALLGLAGGWFGRRRREAVLD